MPSSCTYTYEIGELFTATGTAQANAGDLTQVDGAGTSFTTEFAAGYLITINSETRVVASVSDNTTLVVEAAFGSSVALAAFTGVNLINVESLTVSVFPPKSAFVGFSKPLRLGDGTVRGAGWITGTWAWGYLEDTQRDQMRTFCTGASNSVYIRTRNNENQREYKRYSAVMVWPTGQEKSFHGFVMGLSVGLQDMVEVTVT